nr:MAG TPA: hypothetical protein [Caudoviricetes sp.]
MSSYLNIYLKVKNKDMDKPVFILLDSYSRNSDIYQSVNEAGSYYSDTGEKKELPKEVIRDIIDDLQGQINNCELYISTAKELKSPDIQEIISQKEYKKELEQTREYFLFLMSLLEEYKFNDVEGIYCFID